MADADFTPTSSKSINPPEWDTMNQDEFAENLLAKMKEEPAALTCEEMDIIEKFWNTNRRTRRAALITLTKSYAWLEDKIQSDTEFAEIMVELLECVEPDKYEDITNLLFHAQRRVMCALTCRDDLGELQAKVRAEISGR